MSDVYCHIGVASTFSPRFFPVLSEADRIARRLGAPMSVVHAAPEDEERKRRFDEALTRFERKDVTEILWAEGDLPADAILEACNRHKIDLLLAGALERESDHRYFLGGVARELLRRSTCELLLFPKPEEGRGGCKMVAVAVDVSNPSTIMLNRACQWATRMDAEAMLFLSIVTPFDEAIASAQGQQSDTPEDALAAVVDQASGFDGEVDISVVRSNTGFAVCDFLQDSRADLLIVDSTVEKGKLRTLPPHMDWLLQVIPTNLLLLNRQNAG